MNAILSVKNLNVTLGVGARQLVIAREICFDLRQGELLAVIGESGCGKSLTMQALTGLLPAGGRIETGEITLAGERFPDVVPTPARWRGRGIAYVFQDPGAYLNPLLTIGNQITETAGDRGRALDMLETVSLTPAPRYFGKYPHQLSGGENQRAMIALALSCRPLVLVADEPTTALDPKTENDIARLIKDIQTKRRLSVIWITHDVTLAGDLADRIAVMYAARIVEWGTSRDILETPAHPYTRALLACLPERIKDKKFAPIKGEVPDLSGLPLGCVFAPRCPYRMEICVKREPPLFNVNNEEHSSRCYLQQNA